MRKHLYLLLAAAILVAPGAKADPIFADDFRDGKAGEWKAVGAGDVRPSILAGNVSLRLVGPAAAVRTFSTEKFTGVAIGVSFAAKSLGDNGACIAEASTDAGESWMPVHAVRAGQDDGVTPHPGGGAMPGLEGKRDVLLRLRVESQDAAATCWADNIRVTGRGPRAELPATFNAGGTRQVLTRDELLNPRADARLVATSAFTPSPRARPPTNQFRGRLRLTGERGEHGLIVYRDDFERAGIGDGAVRHLPFFDFEFVQVGEAIVPAMRGAIPDDSPAHEFILEPGRAWDEPEDGGYTRAAIPFTLEERNANCMHNGVLTFIFRDGGKVSDVTFQIGSETCAYFKYDLWGRMAAIYTQGPVRAEASAIATFRHEAVLRMRMKPLSGLAADYPGVRPEQFGSPAEVDPDAMSAYGVVAGGVHYVAGCETRYGPYPFCEVLDLPSYGTATSIFAGVALIRLQMLYPGAAQEKIANYVPRCARAGDWGDVTFENALDMAAGRYRQPGELADESAEDVQPFFQAEYHADKIDFACSHYPRRDNPGTRWIYHSTDTYVLGTAMQRYWREKMGRDADLYRDVLVAPLWTRLYLSPATYVTRRTYDRAYQPLAMDGLTLHRDDVAKIATFLNVDRGRIGGVPQLDPAMLDAAFQRDANNTGPAGSNAALRYNNGFWAWNAQAVLGCRKPAWIPFMAGYGGIVVAFFPNGITYYYFSDGGVSAWAMAAIEADRMKPYCER